MSYPTSGKFYRNNKLACALSLTCKLYAMLPDTVCGMLPHEELASNHSLDPQEGFVSFEVLEWDKLTVQQVNYWYATLKHIITTECKNWYIIQSKKLRSLRCKGLWHLLRLNMTLNLWKAFFKIYGFSSKPFFEGHISWKKKQIVIFLLIAQSDIRDNGTSVSVFTFMIIEFTRIKKQSEKLLKKTSHDASDGWFQSFSFHSATCCMVRASEEMWGGEYSFSEVLTQWSTHSVKYSLSKILI